MRVVDKVTALITRAGVQGPEVVVFEHPLAGIQLPAGTMLMGEQPEAAALREGWEESGLPHLEVIETVAEIVEATPGCGHGRLADDSLVDGVPFTRGHAARVIDHRGDEILVEVVDRRGWIPVGAYCDDVIRHVVHLHTDAGTPEQWWVVTPDGDGLCWRCFWAPVDDVDVVAGQAEWLRVARDRLVPRHASGAFSLPASPLVDESSHLQFWAFPGAEARFVVTWVPATAQVDDRMVRRALTVCRTGRGELVLVSGNGRSMWNFPGGGREPNEDIEATATREVAEEACANAAELRLLGYQHFIHLDDDNNVIDEELHARFAATVELEPFEPLFEIGARRTFSDAEARDELARWWQPDILDRLLAAERTPT